MSYRKAYESRFVGACAALAFVGLLIMGACTVTPSIVNAKGPSLSGNAKDSGFKGWTQDGSAVLNSDLHGRYVALVKLYGKTFTPAINDTDGTFALFGGHSISVTTDNKTWTVIATDGLWVFDKQHLGYLTDMVAMQRMGTAPP